MADERTSIRLPFRVPDSDISGLIRACRSWSAIDVQFIILYPEAEAQGGWTTRPHDRGGPDVFVNVTAPAEHKDQLTELVEKIKDQND